MAIGTLKVNSFCYFLQFCVFEKWVLVGGFYPGDLLRTNRYLGTMLKVSLCEKA